MKFQESLWSAQVFIEIGHRAWCRGPEMQTPEKTHDWVLFVRGKDGNEGIHHFIEKVIFYLHESFKKPTRVVKEPPYKITESGYGIFMAKIEVYFRMKEKEGQSKQIYQHDITLPPDGDPPIELALTEKLTFNHVSEDFIQKVLKGGGTLIEDQDAMITKQQKDGEYKVSKKSRKHQDIGNLIPNISPDLKSCSKEIERRQLEMSLFGGEPDAGTKKVKPDETISPHNPDKDAVIKKKPHNSEPSKVKNRKSVSKMVVKDIKFDMKTCSSENKNWNKTECHRKSKSDHSEQIELKFSATQKDFVKEAVEENSQLSKKILQKSFENREAMSTGDSESESEYGKESTQNNEAESKLVSLSGLPYEELEILYSKIMSLNPEDDEELMMSYKIYKILQGTGKGYDDDGPCFDMHHLDHSVILQLKEIIHY